MSTGLPAFRHDDAFFDRQEPARAQTLRLLLFGLTVIALLLAVNVALALAWRAVSPGFSGYPAHFFGVNTAVTLLFVLGGWWLETSALQGGGEKLARQASARKPGRPAVSQSADCAISSANWRLPPA